MVVFSGYISHYISAGSVGPNPTFLSPISCTSESNYLYYCLGTVDSLHYLLYLLAGHRSLLKCPLTGSKEGDKGDDKQSKNSYPHTRKPDSINALLLLSGGQR
jgi:hypothetical protein